MGIEERMLERRRARVGAAPEGNQRLEQSEAACEGRPEACGGIRPVFGRAGFGGRILRHRYAGSSRTTMPLPAEGPPARPVPLRTDGSNAFAHHSMAVRVPAI